MVLNSTLPEKEKEKMIDKTYILALDKREELWQSLYQECLLREFSTELFIVGDGSRSHLKYDKIDQTGVPDMWKWGTGIGAQRHYWAFSSHKQIIMRALKAGYNNILMLEDDSYFTSRWDKEWSGISDKLSRIEFDYVQLGWHSFEYKDHLFSGHNLEIEEEYYRTGNCYLTQLKQAGGLFGCILNKRLFPMILNMPAVAPIDHQLNMYRPFIKHYATVPSLIYVKSCYSSCEDQFIRRNTL